MRSSDSSTILVVGVTGLKAAGKDIFCGKLEECGFKTFRFSDPIRIEAAQRGISAPTVAELQNIGNEGRRKGGSGYWAERLLDMAREGEYQRIVVNGIRNPGEIDALQGGHLELVGIVAPIMIRVARFLNRERIGDPPTLEGFLHADDRDRGIGEPPDGQQVDRCLAQVEHGNIYNNDGSLEKFFRWGDEFVARLAQSR